MGALTLKFSRLEGSFHNNKSTTVKQVTILGLLPNVKLGEDLSISWLLLIEIRFFISKIVIII